MMFARPYGAHATFIRHLTERYEFFIEFRLALPVIGPFHMHKE